jgi:cytochrome P450
MTVLTNKIGAATAVEAAVPVSGARQRGKRPLEQLPGPKGLPLIGNLLQLDSTRLHLVFEEWARTYGAMYRFRAGPKHGVVVSDPALVEQVLRARPEQYRRIRRVEEVLAELRMPGVFSAEGAAWRPQRRLMTQALSTRNVHAFFPTLQLVLERLRRRWEARAGSTLDILSEFKRLTVDTTTLLAFGHDVNTIERDDDGLQRQLELIFPRFTRRITSALPFWRVLRVPADYRVERAIVDLGQRMTGLIRGARQRLDEDPRGAEAPANLLEAMLATRDEAGQPFAEELMVGNALQILVAGEDTTASTLAWAVHHLCDRPDASLAVQEELDRALGGAAGPSDVETYNRLQQINGVVQESLRLRSVAPIVFLEANADVTLNGMVVPQGTWLIMLTRIAALSSAHFERPLEFRPERWLDSAAEPGVGKATTHMPFGSGPRICPGRALALLELRMALSMLYENFEVERVGRSEQVGERFLFIVEPTHLKVRLHPRRTPPLV